MKIAAFLIAAAVAFGGDELKPVSETHSYDLAANGTLQLKNAAGNIAIEGWDQPRVEVTTVKTAEDRRVMDRVKVTAETKDGVLALSTAYKKFPAIERPLRWSLNFDLEYRIKAPRTAKLVIEEYAGEVNVSGMTGDIQASDRNGDISLVLPDGKYAIDARSLMGAVISDFPGRERRNRLLLGQDLAESEGARRLYLRIRFGDVMIFKMNQPKSAD